MGFLCPVQKVTVLEPQLGLSLGFLHRVAGRDAVLNEIEVEVSLKGSGGSLTLVGGSCKALEVQTTTLGSSQTRSVQ